MAYYNFLKINLKQKILLILFLFIFLLFSVSFPVYSSFQFVFATPDGDLTFNKFPEDYYFLLGYNYRSSNNRYGYQLLVSQTPMEIYENKSSSSYPTDYNLRSSTGIKTFSVSVSGGFRYLQNEVLNKDYEAQLPPSSGTTANFSFSNESSNITIYTNQNIADLDGNLIYPNNEYIPPTLSNSQTELENLNFNNFIINANSFTNEIKNNDGTLFMLFYNRSLSNSQTTDGLYPIKEKGFTEGSIYTDPSSTADNIIYNFPIFKTGVFFNIGSTYEIRFAYKTYNSDGTWQYNYLGDRYVFTISSNVTQDYINQLNQQTATSTDEDNYNELNNSINNQTQSIDNINNSITNSNVDSSSIDLPTDNTNDPTQSGVDNIFQTIYNSFVSGTAQDVVFPIPFTNKNITLQPDYISNALQNNGASWVITIIQAFYWYIVSRFIITDIMKKIRKIKQGNFDNIQNSNIKEDML